MVHQQSIVPLISLDFKKDLKAFNESRSTLRFLFHWGATHIEDWLLPPENGIIDDWAGVPLRTFGSYIQGPMVELNPSSLINSEDNLKNHQAIFNMFDKLEVDTETKNHIVGIILSETAGAVREDEGFKNGEVLAWTVIMEIHAHTLNCLEEDDLGVEFVVRWIREYQEKLMEGIDGLTEKLRLEGDEKERCVICLEDLPIGSDVVRLPCLHVFHDECIRLWLIKGRNCPLCRFEFVI